MVMPDILTNIIRHLRFSLPVLVKHLNSLAQSASGYHKVLAENRKLYNQVQDIKGEIPIS